MTSRRITDDLDAMLGILPPDIADRLREVNRSDELLEVILDLGRSPTARMLDGEVVLLQREVTREDIDYVVDRIGEFDADNRAGMERTLHRISAIRNRHAKIVGLTCRVGRAVYGTIDIIQDLVTSGRSLLLLGRPGVGKTTMLREAARILAESKRVVIVDTSNEIAGDGDVPHPAIGRARRMQVREPVLQHEVMIEGVENHNPEVIVIDEIGRELEAAAARTIAERGVQLIGTAHGNTIENLLLNPTLSDLIGGIESVTLSDEEARRRGTQKTVLERRAAPTFDVLIEIQDRERLAIHPDVAAAVDGMLRGRPLPHELRWRDAEGKIHTQSSAPARAASRREAGYRRLAPANGGGAPAENTGRVALPSARPTEDGALPFSPTPPHMPAAPAAPHAPLSPIRIYAYGVARNRLRIAAKRLHVPAEFVDDVAEAEVIVTLRSYYRRRLRVLTDAEERRVPVYVLRANTLGQMETFLVDLFNLESVAVEDPSMEGALQETELAVQAVLNGTRSVDLTPASSYVRRLQHQMARQANLISHSYGKEPNRRVRIFRD
jgi:stage III sporulation protein SpoIIIAA